MNERILIIDDDPEILSFLEEYFQLNQFQIKTAGSGHDALALIERDSFDLIITDVNLPDFDGFAIVTKIRSLARYLTVPVIAISGVSDHQLESKLSANGVNGFIRKPFNLAQISTEVTNFLNQKNQSVNTIVLETSLEKKFDFMKEQYQKVINDFNNYIQTSTNLLKAIDLQEVAFILLTYATVELNFNQAVLWIVNETSQTLQPIWAIGPSTETEYYQNLNKLSNKSISDLIENFSKQTDQQLNRFVRYLELPLCELHVFSEMMQKNQNYPLVFNSPLPETPVNRKIVSALGAVPFALIPVMDDRNHFKAFIYGNNKFSKDPLNLENTNRLYSVVKIGQMVLDLALVYDRLKESEQSYRNLFDHAADIIFTFDSNLTILNVNATLEKILNYKPSDLINHNIREYLDVDSAESLTNWQLEDYQTELAMVPKLGGVCWVDLRIRHLITREGDILYEGIARDITEKKQLELRLQQTLSAIQMQNVALNQLLKVDLNIHMEMPIDELLNQLCQSVADAHLFRRSLLTIFDEDWQPRHLGYTGISREEINKLREKGFLSKSERLSLMVDEWRISHSYLIPHNSHVMKLLAGRTIPSHFQISSFINWHPDDMLFIPLEVNGVIMGCISFDDPFDGLRPNESMIQILELFANKAANMFTMVNLYKELLDTKLYLSNLIESSSEIIITVDLDCRIVLFNKSAESILHFQSADVLNLSVTTLFEDPTACHKMYSILLDSAQGHIQDWETYMRSMEGKLIPVSISVSVLRDLKRQPIGIEMIAKDMTEHIKLAEIRRKNERLDTINKIAVTVAHEINNPLQIIMDNTRNLFESINVMIREQEQGSPPSNDNLVRARTIWKQIYRIKNITDRLKVLSDDEAADDVAYAHDIKMIDLKPMGKKQRLKNYLILVADDEEEIRTDVSRFLMGLGAQVDMVSNGSEALAKIRQRSYQLILTDIKMPEMDGYQLFQKIRSEHVDTPVLFMTAFGYDPNHVAVRACVEGCPMPLLKPVDMMILEQRILEIIKPLEPLIEEE